MHALLLVPLLLGCADFRLDEDAYAPSGAADTASTDFTSAPPSSTDVPPSASFYGIEVVFSLDAYGAWGEGAGLQVALYGADPAEGQLCSVQVPVEAVAASDAAPAGVYQWWDLTLGEGAADGTGCPAWAARGWSVGVGPYDARLDPAAFAEGLADAELYGLYVRTAEGGPVYVVGVVGTEAMYAGELGLAVEPVAPGSYLARSLLLLDL